jgi:hypothetical protein
VGRKWDLGCEWEWNGNDGEYEMNEGDGSRDQRWDGSVKGDNGRIEKRKKRGKQRTEQHMESGLSKICKN